LAFNFVEYKHPPQQQKALISLRFLVAVRACPRLR
jgi:hypothetical protein